MSNRLPFACMTAILIMVLLGPIPGTAAENIKQIALFPLEVHSTSLQKAAELQDLLYRGVVTELQKSKNIRLIERERIHAGTEGKRINDALVIELGKKVGAHYTVSGSVSEFGNRISVDARLIDLREEKVLPGVFVQGRGRENLDAILAQLRTDILLRIAADERIVRIEFKGNRKIEASAIQQVLKSATGKIFTDEDLSADIKAIYKMGYFEDVTAEVAEVPEGKAITFLVEEKPIITEIRIQGNKEVKRDDIEGAMSVRNRQTVNLEKLKTDTGKIKALYDSKGFYNAEINYAVEKGGERDVHVVVTITENEKLFIRGISFEGNRAFTTKELKNMMTTNEWGIFHFFTESGLLKKDQLKQDVGKLNAFYLNNGFINAQIGEPVISYDRDGIRIKILVSEGKQFRVGKIAIGGDELATPRGDLLAKLQIRKKDFYAREAIMKDMDYLTQVCNDEGYAGADVVP
ncbi:MAG: POTRA domain-containing protein, partial [Deltaproteobacteria bacterium]